MIRNRLNRILKGIVVGMKGMMMMMTMMMMSKMQRNDKKKKKLGVNSNNLKYYAF